MSSTATLSAPILTVEPGLHLHTPEGEAVLAGLGAFNASKLPAPKNRFAVVARHAETDAVLGGMTVLSDGVTGYSHWGAWLAEGAGHATVQRAILDRAAAELKARGGRVLEPHARAHAPLEAYRAAGFREVQRVEGHVLGGDYVVQRRDVADAVITAPAGLSLEVREPVSRPLGKLLWQGTDAYRQRNIPAPFRWASAVVRQDGEVKGGALCYAAGSDFMVDMLWLDKNLRGAGLGFKLLAAALDAGRAMGCTRAGVETMDCQAPGFYPKLGFQKMGYVPTDVPGMGMTFFQMRL